MINKIHNIFVFVYPSSEQNIILFTRMFFFRRVTRMSFKINLDLEQNRMYVFTIALYLSGNAFKTNA